MNEKHIKNCPKCNNIIEYNSKSSLVRSLRMNCICKNCKNNRKKNFSKKELKKFRDNQQTGGSSLPDI